MCRWIACSGTPVLLSQILFQPEHSLIDQSLHPRMGAETTNGDGFGIGWCPQDTETADLEFRRIRRDLALAVDPALYADIEGSNDSDVMFFLALTFGLPEDPPGAVARMAGSVETTAQSHGIGQPLQMTVAVTDGEHVWVFRCSSEGRSRSLYVSTKVDALRALHPDVSFPRELSDETRLVVSEPLGDLPGAWKEVPESSYGVVQPGGGVLHRFRPEYSAGSGALW
ncbi:class II glutamine amidotransferase [Streptomyces rochei]|uniref:Class II glutamine amidotransferase n=1 Tax=Streptomyces rochei TaxID=1928 RepID=A0AAX3ZJF4_STRRO|nr:class II glutamine amidotransferase [Streptomyces rochei]WMC86881.1 class II glutamine amidotransferase [Streptomyces rochei]